MASGGKIRHGDYGTLSLLTASYEVSLLMPIMKLDTKFLFLCLLYIIIYENKIIY